MAAYFDADDERDLSGSVKADTLDCSFVTELSILVDDAMMCFDDRFALSMAKLFYVARS